MLEIKENILATLAYFDMFDYPLTISEIWLFLNQKCQQKEVDEAIQSLVFSRAAFKFGQFYSLKNNHLLVSRRLDGNKKAAELIRVAVKISNMLIKFPYVRGIAISGSLSKNFADENSDIDLFIITEKNRLWIARTLMHLFKKLTFLFKKQNYFCMNYYVDEQQLEIVEKTIYTAIEVVTLIPLQGDIVMERFYASNTWTHKYLPNKIMRLSNAKPVKSGVFKALFEYLLNNRVGNALDNLLMGITKKRWYKKTQRRKLNAKGIVMAMDLAKHYSKPDPRNFQTALLTRYEIKMSQILHQPLNSLAH